MREIRKSGSMSGTWKRSMVVLVRHRQTKVPVSWFRTFCKEPRGTVQIAGRDIPVRAVRTRSERLKDAIDRAYLEKYNTPGSLKYAQDLGRAKSRATTSELVRC